MESNKFLIPLIFLLEVFRMPVSGWRSVGVSVRVEDYPVLQARLRELGYRNLNQLVKDLINGKFTSKIHRLTSKPMNQENPGNGLFLETGCGGRDSNPRTPPWQGGILPG